MLSSGKIKEIMEEYPEVGGMTVVEYQEYRSDKNEKLPCMTSIYKYFSRWAEFKKKCFDNPHINRWWLNENNIIQELLKHPIVKTMTEVEYDIYRKKHNLPTRKTIKKYLGTYEEMKEKIFNGIYEEEVVKRPLECAYCLYEDECPYDYDIDKCKYY